MAGPVAALLKSRTAATHEQVEAHLGLLDGRLTLSRLRAVIERFAGFWPVVEAGVDEWAAAYPRAAQALEWPRRRRSAILAADLVLLAGPDPVGAVASEPAPAPASAPFDGVPGEAEVLGWLYVAEGSTLGGAVIDRALHRVSGLQLPGLSTFTPYPEGPGPMWRAYLAHLESWAAGDEMRARAVADAAQRCFGALADWLAPLRTETAA